MKKEVKVPIYFFAIIGVIIVLFIIWSIVDDTLEKRQYENLTSKELSEVEFEIPEEFEKESNSSYNFYKDGYSCYFHIYSSEKYDYKFIDWFKSKIIVNLNDEVGELQEKEINDNMISIIKVKDKYGFENYYGFESKNYYHYVVFRISDYSNGEDLDIEANPCFTYENRILSSIKVK